jgi:hypothetical protein
MVVSLKKALVAIVFLMILFHLSIGNVFAQRPEYLAPDSEKTVVVPVRENITMIATGGSNIAVQTGELGMVIVDSGNSEASSSVLDALKKISSVSPSYLINTSILPSHTSGNGAIHAAGEGVGSGAAILGMPIIGHTNGLTLLATRFADQIPFDFWPNNAFFGERKDLFLMVRALRCCISLMPLLKAISWFISGNLMCLSPVVFLIFLLTHIFIRTWVGHYRE